jgi:hypothetical protein
MGIQYIKYIIYITLDTLVIHYMDFLTSTSWEVGPPLDVGLSGHVFNSK